jgi:hypothetical protein
VQQQQLPYVYTPPSASSQPAPPVRPLLVKANFKVPGGFRSAGGTHISGASGSDSAAGHNGAALAAAGLHTRAAATPFVAAGGSYSSGIPSGGGGGGAASNNSVRALQQAQAAVGYAVASAGGPGAGGSYNSSTFPCNDTSPRALGATPPW